jgi:HSP20 family protein
MNLEKLNPWNWLKHEDGNQNEINQVPVTQNQANAARAPSGIHSLLQLHREMDRLFENAFNSFDLLQQRFSSSEQRSPGDYVLGLYRPQLDISGDDAQYAVTLNLPGLIKDNIAIEVQGDRLVIRGQKEEKSESKNKHYYRVERSVGAFQRTLSLPEDADVDKIHADLKDGVLALTIPRWQIEKKDVKKISISS